MYYVAHKGNTEISRGISFSKMLDFTEFFKIPATHKFIKLCWYASKGLIFLSLDGSIMLIIKTGGDRAPHNTYYVVQTVDKALLLQGFAIVGTAFLI